jgi:hypothetical protein
MHDFSPGTAALSNSMAYGVLMLHIHVRGGINQLILVKYNVISTARQCVGEKKQHG